MIQQYPYSYSDDKKKKMGQFQGRNFRPGESLVRKFSAGLRCLHTAGEIRTNAAVSVLVGTYCCNNTGSITRGTAVYGMYKYCTPSIIQQQSNTAVPAYRLDYSSTITHHGNTFYHHEIIIIKGAGIILYTGVVSTSIKSRPVKYCCTAVLLYSYENQVQYFVLLLL